MTPQPKLAQPRGPGWWKLSHFAEAFNLTPKELAEIVSPMGGLQCFQHPHYDDDLGNFENYHVLKRWLDTQPARGPWWLWMEVNAVADEAIIAWINLDTPWTREIGRRAPDAVFSLADGINERRTFGEINVPP